jgi:hypothetical protein
MHNIKTIYVASDNIIRAFALLGLANEETTQAVAQHIKNSGLGNKTISLILQAIAAEKEECE